MSTNSTSLQMSKHTRVHTYTLTALNFLHGLSVHLPHTLRQHHAASIVAAQIIYLLPGIKSLLLLQGVPKKKQLTEENFNYIKKETTVLFTCFSHKLDVFLLITEF